MLMALAVALMLAGCVVSKESMYSTAIEEDVEAGKKYVDTPLHLAAIHGDVETVKVLLEAGADVNAADKIGMTPLHYAASRGHGEVVKVLLKESAR